ncbi:hypothetical protein JCM3770_003498 [Rhodotorula araucariae]
MARERQPEGQGAPSSSSSSSSSLAASQLLTPPDTPLQAREKAAKAKQDATKGQRKDDGKSFRQRQEDDAQKMREKQASRPGLASPCLASTCPGLTRPALACRVQAAALAKKTAEGAK